MTKQDAPDLTLASAPPPALTAVGGFPEGATRPLREETVAQVAGAMGEQGSPSGRVRVPHGAAAKERFIDLEPIGQGGMGEVFRVTDSVLRRDLAMKIIRPHVEQQPDLVAAFLTEAQVTAQLDHPGIVPVHDLGASADGSGVFFTMKRVIGVNLSEQLLGLRGTRPQYQVLKRLIGYLIKVCHALEFAHARGVLHCDIKPANIMIGDYDQVYLMDWGVAVIKQDVGHKPTAPGAHLVPFGADAIGSTSGPLSGVVSGPVSSYPTTNRGVVGTPAYMAPEQASGSVAVLDERTDVYGLGGVLYEILGGKAPNHRRPSVLPGLVAEEVRPPEEGEIWDDLPPGLVDAALTALRKAKEARQSSVAVFRRWQVVGRPCPSDSSRALLGGLQRTRGPQAGVDPGCPFPLLPGCGTLGGGRTDPQR